MEPLIVSSLLLMQRIAPVLVGGAILAVHDARTHTVLPLHVCEILTAQILWSFVSGLSFPVFMSSCMTGLVLASLFALSSRLPGEPVGEGDALTSFVFALALGICCNNFEQYLVILMAWMGLTAVFAGITLFLMLFLTLCKGWKRSMLACFSKHSHSRKGNRHHILIETRQAATDQTETQQIEIDQTKTWQTGTWQAAHHVKKRSTNTGTGSAIAFVPAQYCAFIALLWWAIRAVP